MAQTVEPLPNTIIEWLEAQRDWVGSFYPVEHRHLFDTVNGKLEVMAIILKNKWFQPESDWKLEALGVVLGDALIQRMDMRWVIVEDKFGKTLVVELEGGNPVKSVYVHPLGMIKKRFYRGENIDVAELFDKVCETVKFQANGPDHQR